MNPNRAIPSPHRRRREIDLLAVGELLVDFIGEEPPARLAATGGFRRYPGGSAANLAANLARLGNRVALVARVGDDGLGEFLRRNLEAAGVQTEAVAVDSEAPTSLVVVSRGGGTAEFIPYRGADARIAGEQLRDDLVERSTLYHTSCFALARQPARGVILDGARRAVAAGARLSLDVNYAPQVWPEREEAQEVVAGWCGHGPLVKASADDVARLFGGGGKSAQAAAERFHAWGAELVCVTEGPWGCLVSWDGGRRRVPVAAPPVKVADATGAGDAFWAGFLTAWLDGREPSECARAGVRLATLKLAVVGPLAGPVGREVLDEG